MKINGKEVKDYIYTDSATECVDGLKHLNELLDKVLEYGNNWRWVIFTLHNVVQNFMVITLRDSSGTNILKKNIQADYYKSLRDDTVKRPKEVLDYFMSLYKSTKDPNEMRKYMDSRHFVPNKTQDESMDKLNEIRNEFTHFIPKGYIAYMSGMPDIIKDCLDYIDFLTFKSFHLSFHRDKDLDEIRRLIDTIKTKCDFIFSKYIELNKEREANKDNKDYNKHEEDEDDV